MARAKRHKHGEGTLTIRGNVWLARWTDTNGRRHSRSTGETSRELAELKLREFSSESRTATIEAAAARAAIQYRGRIEEEQAFIAKRAAETPALTVADAWREYVAKRPGGDGGDPDAGTEGKTASATIEQYAVQYHRFCEWLAANCPDVKELRGVSRDTARAFMDSLRTTRSANTFNKYLHLLRDVWKVLRESAKTTCNPWEEISPRRGVKGHRRRTLTLEELRRVLDTAKGEMHTLFAIGVYTGLRLGDAATLDWGRVDLGRETITLVPRKTARKGTEVEIPIHPDLAKVLRGLPACEGRIMPDVAAQYERNPRWLIVQIQRAFEKAGIETHAAKLEGRARCPVDVGFHSLRHTFVSMCVNGNVPLEIVQDMVGHGNPVMTEHYLHASGEAKRRAVGVIPSIGAKKPHKRGTREKGGGGPLNAFAAILAGMTDEERREAARMIADAARQSQAAKQIKVK